MYSQLVPVSYHHSSTQVAAYVAASSCSLFWIVLYIRKSRFVVSFAFSTLLFVGFLPSASVSVYTKVLGNHL
jgi:hypothetical protein